MADGQDRMDQVFYRDLRLLALISTWASCIARWDSIRNRKKCSIRLSKSIRITVQLTQIVNSQLALQEFDEARQTVQKAQSLKIDGFILHNALYGLAFLQRDPAAMAEQQKWFATQPDSENFGIGLESDTETYAGHLVKAR